MKKEDIMTLGMFFLIMIAFVWAAHMLTAPPNVEKIEKKRETVLTVEGAYISYELITIGPYTCVGVKRYEDGTGVWCENTGEKK